MVNFTELTHGWTEEDERLYFIMFQYARALLLLTGVINVTGLCTNAINIYVFVKMGLQDCVTISLFALAVGDLGFLAAKCFKSGFQNIAYNTNMDYFPWAVHYTVRDVSDWAYVFGDFTIFTTVFLAVTRCACVTWPIHFKHTYTKRRTWFTLAFLLVVAVSFRWPLYQQFEFLMWYDPWLNRTMISYLLTGDVEFIITFNSIAHGFIMAPACIIVVLICMAVMIYKVRQSSKFRSSQSALQSEGVVKKTQDARQKAQGGFDESTDQEKAAKLEDEQRMSSKENRIVLSVIYVLAVFACGVGPPAISMLFYQILGGYLYPYLTDPEFLTVEVFHYISVSVNIFIYYRFNTKYRKTFVKAFGMCRKNNNKN